MSDGSYTVATFNEPVHMNVDGSWVEVDNTLKLSTKADGVSRYETVNGLADVSFAREFQSELVTMMQDEYSISWGLTAVSSSDELTVTTQLMASDVKATVISSDLSEITLEEQKTMALKSTSAVHYGDALGEDVDLDYVVLPSRVKESIILNSPTDMSAYVLDVTVENLSARLLDSREVEFYNENDEVIFTMWAPYMYDRAGELSENIAVQIVRKGRGGYLVSIVPDQEWLSDPERIYPVVIDPDVSASRVRTNIIDNYVLEGSGNQDRNLDRMYIGLRSGHVARSYLRYAELPTLPANAQITRAQQTLFITANTSTANTANAYRVTGGTWASGTITWDNKPAANVTVATGISHNNCTKYTFTCTNAVKHWYTDNTSGTYQNYGFMIRYTDETIEDYNACYSADYSEESMRPLLTISYSLSGSVIELNYSNVSITEGSTKTLTATTTLTGQTLTWYTYDTSIATVSSSGVIMAHNPGMTAVTVSVQDANGTTYTDSCTIYVVIPNGLYHIANVRSQLYLQAGGSISNNTNVSQYSCCPSHYLRFGSSDYLWRDLQNTSG